MNKSRPHNSEPSQRYIEASKAKCLPHPAYSPDPVPGNFYLFGSIKGKPSDDNCESREDLLNAVSDTFIGTDHEMLLSVFESWVNRLKWVIKHDGKHYIK
jgi:hypothetical protein